MPSGCRAGQCPPPACLPDAERRGAPYHHACDQVPRLQAAAGAGAGGDRRGSRARAPRSTCSPARPGWPRSSSAGGSRSRRPTCASYSEVLSDCYIATDADEVDRARPARRARRGSTRCPGEPGYVTRTFCEESRYFQPHNGARIDAIRAAIERDHPDGPLRPILLTALLLAADRVDSTTGLQMAYLKQWSAALAPRPRAAAARAAARARATPSAATRCRRSTSSTRWT